jgi:hypothetical protein
MLESEFLFMGLCPHENVLKCFKVSLNTVDGKAELSTTEELVNNNTTIFLGSGSNRAKNILLAHKTNSLNDYLKHLKK